MAGNAKISRVTSIKYLGIYIDQQLNWQEHINSICKKISPIIGILSKIRHLVTFPILRQLYYALIHPHILYCIEAWGSAYQNHVKPLIILQKRAIRIITFSHPQSHTDQLFKFMTIFPFYKLYFLVVCQLLFNELNGASNVNFGFQHRCLTHNYNTRNKHLLSQLKHQTNYFCQSILHIGPKFYNFMPEEIKNSVSIFSFKRKLKSWLEDTNFDIYVLIFPHRKLSI